MAVKPTRRTVLAATSTAAVGSLLLGPARASDAPTPEDGAIHAGYPTQESSAAKEVVGAAHANIERVEELVTARPELAKASWDWGFGDWESALGAASHMGRRDIADLLIENGARPTIFYAAMTGNLEAVKAFITAFPGIQSLHGPHGITLMGHAKAGKEAAEPVVRYLEKVGYADMKYTDVPLEEGQHQSYVGTYAFGDGDDERFEIVVPRRGQLAIRRGEGFGRTLFHQGEHEFHPAGAPTARVRFAMADGRASSFEIHNPQRILTARRIVTGV